ncbi:glycosyltransferase family protein [Flavobacterium celericrescens]|uniref:Glycosyltransferase family 4 protein n=1 Tax=Flavobacterium celericrescens TaxID=2709780 RepID=A0ABX0II25_9FLAO|nr:glycosyltransferase [Flavobacterium celericrescens]NHM05277.1 glycosyltransferase family 4 protein [Flavobacterium celericrescens]
MKILLIGEYSRLHNSLKEGLMALGHEVTIVGCGDKFKQFPVDFSIYARICNDNKIANFLFKSIRKVIGFNLEKIEKAIRFYLLLSKLNHYQHVQLINSDALETYPILSRFLYKKLFQNIQSRSLLVCGDETPIIDYLFKKEFKYSVLTPYFEDNSIEKEFQFPLKYRNKNYRKTFNWLVKNCQNLITSDLDYEIPMQKMGFQTTFIPNPINTDKITFQNIGITDKIVIFLGINRLSYSKKGIIYFEKALEIIREKYADKIEIIVSENLPYSEYISTYNRAHILLDQVFAYDQGYNALEAMAKGKVVFTGAETEFLNQYQLQADDVCINAKPNENEIAKKLSFLIEDPEKINKISKNARKFIEKEHAYKIIAEKYFTSWN